MRDKSTHTPGPWAEFNQDGSRIFKQWGVQGASGKRVCWVENGPQCDKDARLIAAAPDLLAACREVSSVLNFLLLNERSMGNDPDLKLANATLNAAIASAEGGAA